MTWHQEKTTFTANVQSVLELLDFDRAIIEIAVDGLRSTANEVADKYGFHTVVTTLNNRASMLDRIREGDRLRPKYETIFNQCVVLLVSYFDSAVRGVFRRAVMAALRSDSGAPVAAQTLSVSWNALEQTQGDRERIFADLLVAQKNISFQDMQSVVRAFRDYLAVDLERTEHTDNVILGQAARHVIVHANSRIDDKMLKQVSGATLRTLKSHLTRGSLRFTPQEVIALADSMNAYLDALCALLDGRMAGNQRSEDEYSSDVE